MTSGGFRQSLAGGQVGKAFLDGGRHRQYGWGRWRGELETVLEAGPLAAGPSLKSIRVYDRYLRTAEAVGGRLASFSS
ncbi:MAG: hypothetical protein K8R46_14015 [Pirellulales bacterium]|nr:hypothetical protein [Pirellulales bacterium]